MKLFWPTWRDHVFVAATSIGRCSSTSSPDPGFKMSLAEVFQLSSERFFLQIMWKDKIPNSLAMCLAQWCTTCKEQSQNVDPSSKNLQLFSLAWSSGWVLPFIDGCFLRILCHCALIMDRIVNHAKSALELPRIYSRSKNSRSGFVQTRFRKSNKHKNACVSANAMWV